MLANGILDLDIVWWQTLAAGRGGTETSGGV